MYIYSTSRGKLNLTNNQTLFTPKVPVPDPQSRGRAAPHAPVIWNVYIHTDRHMNVVSARSTDDENQSTDKR